MKFSWIAAALALVACRPVEELVEDGLRLRLESGATGSQGLLRVRVPVVDDRSLLITASVPSPHQVFVYDVQAPSGDLVWKVEDEWASVDMKSGGMFADTQTTLNWPVVADDVPLTAGTWQIHLGVLDQDDYYAPGIGVDVATALAPAAASVRTLKANIVLSGAIATDTAARGRLETAVAHWQALYRQVGIEVVPTWTTAEADDLYFPGLGSGDVYEAISASTSLRSINVVVVRMARQGDLYLGLAGAIPGPLTASPRSAITISYLTHAGADLQFSADEVRVLGETMAHESGHFLGLFHPVESEFDRWDVLADTPECASANQCERQLGDNLMFPYAICDGSSCVEQHRLTGGQQGVMQNYTGVE